MGLERKTIEEPKELGIDEVADVLECDVKVKSRGILLWQFFLPFILATVLIGVLFLTRPENQFYTIVFWMVIYFVPPMGKETVIPFAIAGDKAAGALPFDYPAGFVPIEPWMIASVIAFMDILVGIFLVWNFDIAKKIPLLGKYICKIEGKGSKMLSKSKSLETLSFIGIVLFVMFPFQGSGGVGASIVGRAIGMNPYKVLAGIVVGSIVGCFLIAYAFESFMAVFMKNSLAGIILLVLVLAIVVSLLLIRRKNNATADQTEQAQAQQDEDDQDSIENIDLTEE